MALQDYSQLGNLVPGPGTAIATIGSLLGGGADQPKEQTQYYLAPEQLALLKALMAEQYTGGDAGLGADLKAGNSTLSSILASRGVSPGSGVAASAMGDMTAQAVAAAAQRRFQNLASLISATPAMASGKIQSPDVAGYAWSPTGLQTRGAYQSPYGNYDASYAPTSSTPTSALPAPGPSLGTGLGRTPTQRARGQRIGGW